MSLSRLFSGALVAVALTFAAGCIDNDIPADNTNPVLPGAISDPNGMTGLENGEPWGPGAGENSLTGPGSADEWTAVDPGNNLGFPIVYFGYDTDELPPAETAKLDKVAAYLAQQAQLGLIIEGHCDQRGTEEYNRALGERRANAIRAYLAGAGLSDERMKTISFGEDRPAVEGSGESAWSQNRRGVLVPARMK